MQGLQAEESIINSLELIYNNEDIFDLVVIIRGGGSQADLNCFDSYNLASNVAQFPLPIVTGIGHDKDESITDIVAYKKLKTPTAVAEYIVDKTNEFDNYLNLQKEKISNFTNEYFDNLKYNLSSFISKLHPVAKTIIDKNSFLLKITAEQVKSKTEKNINKKATQLAISSRLLSSYSKNNINRENNNVVLLKNKLEGNCKLIIQNQNHFLKNNQDKIELLNPSSILKRGYSITYKNGKQIKSINELDKKDEIITELFSGFVRSTVEEKKKTQNKT